MPEIAKHDLLRTSTIVIRDMICAGRFRERSAEEFTPETHLAFPYRGVFVRHVGSDDAVADANQVLFFNAGESYRVSHPPEGGDDSLDVVISDPTLNELTPRSLMLAKPTTTFRQQRVRIDARAQTLVALLLNRLRLKSAEPLEAESVALALVQRVLGSRTAHLPGGSRGGRLLVDRTKLLLTSDLGSTLDAG